MRKERTAINRITPDRYILATSVSLTPANKCTLASIIGPSLNDPGDIFGIRDLNGLLRKHEEVTKAHIKLWLTNTAVLERVLYAASHNFTRFMLEEIKVKLKFYVQNPSFKLALDILKSKRVLIVSGAPGVGKTTLARMLCYTYIAKGWEFVAMETPKDWLSRVSDAHKQIFFHDDFLGVVDFNKQDFSTNNPALKLFLSRVERTPNARLVMTTRSHIYKQAQLASETFSHRQFDVRRYTLDVGVYTRRIRARILYNHLFAASVPYGHICALIKSGTIKKIVDHEHYSPRILEWMTGENGTKCIPAERYADEFLLVLDNPQDLWDHAFRIQITPRCQNLLYALYFASESGEEIDQLRKIFDGIHPLLCLAYGHPRDKNDFEESLKTLEGGFVVIDDQVVSYINPSVRDYLKGQLLDKEHLIALAGGAPNAKCAKQIVDQFRCIPQLDKSDMQALLKEFTGLSKRLNSIPIKQRFNPKRPRTFANLDMKSGLRIDLLLNWWRDSPESIFLETATVIARQPIHEFDKGQDTEVLIELLASLLKAPVDERNQTKALVDSIETAIHRVFKGHFNPDNLNSLIETIDARKSILGQMFKADIETAIPQTIENIDMDLSEIDSVAELDDHAQLVEKFAKRVECNQGSVDGANDAIQRRIDEIEDPDADDEDPWNVGDYHDSSDHFTDHDLDSLFADLVTNHERTSDDI